MPTSQITNTVTDASGVPAVGVPVSARLKPPGGFRLDTGNEITSVATVTGPTGLWTLNLERNANISPANSYYLVEEDIPDQASGPRQWAIIVGPTNQTVLAAMINPPR